MKSVYYTASATTSGGRNGHVKSSDGVLDLDLTMPKEMGGEGGSATNPEQLFAAGSPPASRTPYVGSPTGRTRTWVATPRSRRTSTSGSQMPAAASALASSLSVTYRTCHGMRLKHSWKRPTRGARIRGPQAGTSM